VAAGELASESHAQLRHGSARAFHGGLVSQLARSILHVNPDDFHASLARRRVRRCAARPVSSATC
jgi:hypothetical protein